MADPPKTSPERPDQRVPASRLKPENAQTRARILFSSGTGSFYDDDHVFFILETICVVAFAVSFIVKGHGQPNDPGLNAIAGEQRAVEAATAIQPAS
jgi:hypothetical protein